MPHSSTMAARATILTVNPAEVTSGVINTIIHKGNNIVLKDVLGKGAFGTVYRASHIKFNCEVALKQVKQDTRYKNRELDILKVLATYKHENVITLLDSFYTFKENTTYLNLVLELIPETLISVLHSYSNDIMPEQDISHYMKQVFRALRHLNSLSICHRDIKPHNLLVNPLNRKLKLADFGSAKLVKNTEPNISYICSRFYRAPELVLGATYYDTKIDIWAAGCVLAELYLGTPLFVGKTATDQLLQIFTCLGVPTEHDLRAMKAQKVAKFPSKLPKKGIQALFELQYDNKNSKKSAVDLLSKILVYDPNQRYSAQQVLLDPYFSD